MLSYHTQERELERPQENICRAVQANIYALEEIPLSVLMV